MNSARLKKYDTGRLQKSRHREKTGKILLECGVGEYLSDVEAEEDRDAGVAVMTVPAQKTKPTNGDAKTPQMLLWDQPVALATPTEPADKIAKPQSVAASPAPTPTDSEPKLEEQFTILGLLKGCAIGLAMAAILLLIYVLIH